MKKPLESNTIKRNLYLLVFDTALFYFWPFIEQAGMGSLTFALASFLKAAVNIYSRFETTTGLITGDMKE